MFIVPPSTFFAPKIPLTWSPLTSLLLCLLILLCCFFLTYMYSIPGMSYLSPQIFFSLFPNAFLSNTLLSHCFLLPLTPWLHIKYSLDIATCVPNEREKAVCLIDLEIKMIKPKSYFHLHPNMIIVYLLHPEKYN